MHKINQSELYVGVRPENKSSGVWLGYIDAYQCLTSLTSCNTVMSILKGRKDKLVAFLNGLWGLCLYVVYAELGDSQMYLNDTSFSSDIVPKSLVAEIIQSNRQSWIKQLTAAVHDLTGHHWKFIFKESKANVTAWVQKELQHINRYDYSINNEWNGEFEKEQELRHSSIAFPWILLEGPCNSTGDSKECDKILFNAVLTSKFLEAHPGCKPKPGRLNYKCE